MQLRWGFSYRSRQPIAEDRRASQWPLGGTVEESNARGAQINKAVVVCKTPVGRRRHPAKSRKGTSALMLLVDLHQVPSFPNVIDNDEAQAESLSKNTCKGHIEAFRGGCEQFC